MEPQINTNPIINFIKNVFNKLSNTALLSILSTNSSATIGDEYLENSTDLTKYKESAAEEAGYSKTQAEGIDKAFETAINNIKTLETSTTQIPAEKDNKFEVFPEELSDVQIAEPEHTDSRTSGNSREHGE